jgi:hypothetical protein
VSPALGRNSISKASFVVPSIPLQRSGVSAERRHLHEIKEFGFIR